MISEADLHLVPWPRELQLASAGYEVPAAGVIRLGSDPAALLFTARQVQTALATTAPAPWALTAGAAVPPVVRLAIDPATMPHAQGYQLTVGPEGIVVVGHDAAGVFYGVQTLRQLLRQYGRGLPGLTVRDWPDFPARGVMLDISRDKVPTLATVCQLVDKLAGLKLNQLQLYMEHTFAYPQHEVVWAQASPFTAEEILALDAYCQERFVELVPNQNSFGHMERWLKHDRYNPLAEAPRGFTSPWGQPMSAFSLCPGDPGSIELLRGLYAELLPNFQSRLFNVGCDETWDLGQGRSHEVCEKRGTVRVYLDFLVQLRGLAREHGRTLMFWGDIIMKHPELIAELPRDVIALEWGYEAGHPFAEDGAKFAASGIPFYVCPGTSSWNTIAGRSENAFGNLRNAAENGRRHGACGFLNTDWGDCGHWQYLPVSYLPFAWGAALSWAAAANRDRDLVPAVSRHLFGDASGTLGRLVHDLGNAYRVPGKLTGNSSILFHLLVTPLTQTDVVADLTAEKLAATEDYVAECLSRLTAGKGPDAEAELVRRELRNAGRTLVLACHLGLFRKALAANAEAGVLRGWARGLAAELQTVLAEHRELWLARNRPGGLPDSLAVLGRRLAECQAYASGH